MALEPGGIIAWLLVGLIAGWLTGKVMKGAGYGAFRDIILGIVGAFIGGIVMNLFGIVVAFIGAVIFAWVVRAVPISPRVARASSRWA